MAKKRRYTSKDAYLDEAIDRLEHIDSGSHQDTALYQGVMDSIQRLHTITSRFYDSPIKTETDLTQIRAAYEDVRAACDSYLEKNSGLHLHLYKKQREHGIRAIRDIIDHDLFAMDPKHPAFSHSKNLKELLASARKSTVSVDDPAAVQSVGGSVSTRIPIAMKGEAGEERGFFTERSHVESDAGLASRIHDQFQGRIGSDAGVPDDYRKLLGIYDSLAKKVNHGPFNIDKTEACASADSFYRQYEDVLRTLYGEDLTEKQLISKIRSRKTREAIHDFCQESYRSIRQQINQKEAAEIAEGHETATRNVAMSRMAETFGMKDLVAHAETMDLRIGDRTVSGVFMETAEGEDLSLTKEGDPLERVFRSEKDFFRGMDTAHAKSQLADLQVLDFLCGNGDRHERNFIYQMGKDENGEPCVTGITGIDNDLSFGKLTDALTPQGRQIGSLVPPDSIKIMTKATYDTIMGMTPQALSTQLADLGLDANEQQAAVARLNALKARLAPGNVVMSRPDMPTDLQFQIAQKGMQFDPAHPNDLQFAQRVNPNPVLVVQDETGFGSISFQTLAQQGDMSYFSQMAKARSRIMEDRLFQKATEKKEAAVEAAKDRYLAAPRRGQANEERLAEMHYQEHAQASRGPQIRYAGATRIGAFVDHVVKRYGVRKSLRELRELSEADAAREKTERSAGAAARKQQRKQAAQAPSASARKRSATV